jgi:hypothetical protein
MPWQKVTLSKENPQAIEVDLKCITGGDKLFGAARIYVTAFGCRQACFALRAGDDKRILPPEAALEWLVEEGLPAPLARGLLEWAAEED